jgi:hypothetical protein
LLERGGIPGGVRLQERRDFAGRRIPVRHRLMAWVV